MHFLQTGFCGQLRKKDNNEVNLGFVLFGDDCGQYDSGKRT